MQSRARSRPIADMEQNSLLMSMVNRKTFKKGDLFVSVMGITGSGKSAFISLLTNEFVEVGHGLQSCTKVLHVYTIKAFGKTIHLIDTPGFDDTTRTDYEVLVEITSWLNLTFKAHICLSGVIYLHRISDDRMGGAASLNLRTFTKLIGEENMGCVILATTHWDIASDPRLLQLFYDREKQLKTEFWSKMIDGGALMTRHQNTPNTASSILYEIVRKRTTTPLKVQLEMSDGKMELGDTSAGREVRSELIKQEEMFQRQLRQIKEEQEEAGIKLNEKYSAELAKEREMWERRLNEVKMIETQLKQKTEDQIAQKMMEVKTLSKLVKEIQAQRDEDTKETRTLREKLEAAQKAARESVAFGATVTAPDGTQVESGGNGAGAAAALVVLEMLHYGFCSVM